jgi:hypothetical protein
MCLSVEPLTQLCTYVACWCILGIIEIYINSCIFDGNQDLSDVVHVLSHHSTLLLSEMLTASLYKSSLRNKENFAI